MQSNHFLLIFRQTHPFYLDPDTLWLNHNSDKPTDPNYSILDRIDNTYKGDDGKFLFKLRWPGLEGGKEIIWKQSSNPVTAVGSGTTGYENVACDYTGYNWAGLEKNIGYESLLDGSVGVWDWNYAVG